MNPRVDGNTERGIWREDTVSFLIGLQNEMESRVSPLKFRGPLNHIRGSEIGRHGFVCAVISNWYKARPLLNVIKEIALSR